MIQPEAVELKHGKFVESLGDAKDCIQTNYYGAKRMTDALIPLLQLSHSPRIVNVSSIMGNLKVNTQHLIIILITNHSDRNDFEKPKI